MSSVPALTQIVSGDADDPSRDMSNWNAIRNVVNGNLDTTNLSATAAITAAQTVFGTYTAPVTYTATLSGFSSLTTQETYYCVVGKRVDVLFRLIGTSNGAGITMSLPTGSALIAIESASCRTTDNGAAQTSPGLIEASAAATSVSIYKTLLGDGFTTSGAKAAIGQFVYFLA